MASAAGIAGAATAGALGSIASQGLGVATGLQDRFSWTGVALAGLSSGIGAGLSGTFDGLSSSAVVRGALEGAAGNALTQGVGVVTGLQRRFDWTGVAVGAAVGGTVGGVSAGLNLGPVGNSIVAGMAGAIAGAATRSVLDGTDFGDNVLAALPDVIGSTIGNLVAGAIVGGAGASDELGRPSRASSPTWHASQLADDPNTVYVYGSLLDRADGILSWLDRLVGRIGNGFSRLASAFQDNIYVQRITAAVRPFVQMQAAVLAEADRRYQITATFDRAMAAGSAFNQRYQVTTRAMGAVQTAGGVFGTVSGGALGLAGIAGEPLTFGASSLAVVGGGATMLVSADATVAGFRTVISGRAAGTVGAHVISTATGITPTHAELAYGGVQIVTGVGAASALRMGAGVIVAEGGAVSPLQAGRLAEVEQLNSLGSSGKVSFIPTQAQIDSAAFKVIVGEAKYTPKGAPVGTIYDASGAGLAEIKTGSSVLDSSYQLRLQTYGALVNDTRFTI